MADRRSFLRIGLATVSGALVALGNRLARASHLPVHTKTHKVVYHLNEADLAKNKFVLGNMRNHIAGVGGPQNLEMELVVHGPALKNFVTKTMDLELKKALESLQLDGMQFGACGNTMKAFKITLEELPQGATHLPQGGVVRVMELQEQGYIYIRS